MSPKMRGVLALAMNAHTDRPGSATWIAGIGGQLGSARACERRGWVTVVRTERSCGGCREYDVTITPAGIAAYRKAIGLSDDLPCP